MRLVHQRPRGAYLGAGGPPVAGEELSENIGGPMSSKPMVSNVDMLHIGPYRVRCGASSVQTRVEP